MDAPDEGRRASGRLVLALIWAVATVVGLRVLLWSGDVPSPVEVAAERYFDPSQVAADRSYRGGLWGFAVVLTLLVPAVAIAVAATSRRWAARLTAVPAWLGGGLVGIGIALLTALITAPLRLWRHDWVVEHGVGRQPRDAFVADLVQAALIQAAILGAVGAVIAVAIQRGPRRWWIALGGGVAALGTALTLLSPVLVQPLFESTTPVRDPSLVAEIRSLAAREGVEVGEVLVSDASTRSRAVNARVEGLFGTQRVVLDDTLINETPAAQVRWVVAHELVHVSRHHVLKGVAWMAALALPLALMVSAVVALTCGPARARSDDLLRRVAATIASVSVLLVLVTPLENWVSRAYETEADWRALQLAGDPDAAVAHRVLARDLARADPDPPRLLQLWFGTHPTPLERVGLIERFRQGQAPAD